jgi:ABC transport system ATP-binding/permease protein
MVATGNLVNLENVSKAHGTTVLLDAVSLGVGAGDRVGVVGRNGGGKTTLLSVLTRTEPPDSGRVTHAGGLRLAQLAQDATPPPAATVREVVVGDAATHEWAGDAGVRAVLAGLGLPALGLDTVVGPMSGGERRRVALAALLVRDTDLLVLDEPTNHLDVEAVDWLAAHLAARPGALLVVTHDRWFLDAVCTDTWEVADGRVHTYQGGYSAYVLARAERERTAAASESRRQNLLRKELAWLRRGPPARTSKPRFRIDAANALIADEPPARDDVSLQRFAAARLGRQVYDVEEVTVRLGYRTLLEDATWRLGPGDRIGVIGVNGSGKTTLLRLLAGELAPAAGAVLVGKTVRPAYLSQEVTELDPELRVLAAVESVARVIEVGRGRELTATQLLERFGFVGGSPWTRVGDLSGGERRRLQLLRLLMSEPNVLLLDEPTNDLDIDTLTALEDLLDGWPGTLVVVSHDRYFLERTCGRIVALLGDGRLSELPGGVAEYLARRRAAGAADAIGASPAAARQRTGDSRAARKELLRLERLLERLTQRADRIHADMAASASDYAAVSALDGELRAVLAETAAAEDAWLQLADEAS